MLKRCTCTCNLKVKAGEQNIKIYGRKILSDAKECIVSPTSKIPLATNIQELLVTNAYKILLYFLDVGSFQSPLSVYST